MDHSLNGTYHSRPPVHSNTDKCHRYLLCWSENAKGEVFLGTAGCIVAPRVEKLSIPVDRNRKNRGLLCSYRIQFMAKPYVFNRHRRVIYKRNKIFLRSKLRLYCILKETNVKMLYVVYKTTTKKKKKRN